MASGPSRGKSKTVGRTASGTTAQHGTIAADPTVYPLGTVMDIPGYGKGRVEDTGGAIRGPERPDLFFNSHQQALEWGRQRLPVKVWMIHP
ncbi:MAG: hypothetical protein FJ220_07705 [Kiritimatiellaceae bacterium]|nr:hypothetical protein [Kiritimatiellaceae bacterium]